MTRKQFLPLVVLLAVAALPAAAAEDVPSWVAPMKKVRARFTGTPEIAGLTVPQALEIIRGAVDGTYELLGAKKPAAMAA